MKITHTIAALTAAVALSTGAALRADTIKLTYVTGYAQKNGGGEFTAVGSHLSLAGYSSSNKVNGGFETFCIWEGGNIRLGTAYSYTLSDSVPIGPEVAPGVPAGGFGPLSEGAAWLYWEFATGHLAGYDYTPGSSRAADATALQQAIWMFQGDQPINNSNAFVILADSSIAGGQAAAVGAESAALEKTVKVLNLYGPTNFGNPTIAQSQLYIQVPDSTTTLALFGAGLACLAGFRRLRRPAVKNAA